MFTRRFLLPLIAVVGFALLPALAQEGHKGPNGGVLFEGAKHKYHIELKVDPAAKTATAFILDSKAKKAVPVKAKTIELKFKGSNSSIKLDGVPRKNRPDSFTRFKATHDRFGEKLDFDQVEIVAQIVAGKPAFTFTPED